MADYEGQAKLVFEFKTIRFAPYDGAPEAKLNVAGEDGWDVASSAFDPGGTLTVILRRAKIETPAPGGT